MRANSKEQWNIVENTHEPIIDRNVFEIAQKIVISQKYNRNNKKHNFLLDGLLICYECKHKIGVKKRNNGHYSMVCNNYRRNSKLGLCTSHGFNYEELEYIVLNYIKSIFIEVNTKQIELDVKKSKTKTDYKKMLEKIELDIKQINTRIDNMYIDKLDGKISEEMYERIYNELRDKEQKMKKRYEDIINETQNRKQEDIEQIKKVIKEFLKLEKPTPEIMKVIISRIEIHQDKQVDIIFNFKRLNDICV